LFAPIFGPTMTDALDDLFGAGGWMMPKHYGQVLITMPNARTWRVPHRLWHADFQYLTERDDLFAVKYWALFSDIEPGGGATPQLAGSHRAMARYLEGRVGDQLEYKRARDGFLRSHEWLRALQCNDDDPARNGRFIGADVDLDGLPVRVIECTGKAGDVYLTHPWVMHSIAANARHEPRFMRSMAIYAARNASSTGDQRSGSLL
jgi:ectoine hydroxylase-related dioxygenase (phytanoyl-CoA dioxygenase family)